MRESNFIGRIKEKADMRALVVSAMEEAIAQVALQNKMAPKNATAAMEAVREELARDVSTHRLADLRSVAEDVALNAFAALGYDNAKIHGDLYVAVDDNINNRTKQKTA